MTTTRSDTASTDVFKKHSLTKMLSLRDIQTIMVTVAAGVMLGRLLAVDSVDVYQLERQRFAEIPRKLELRRAELQAKGLPPQRVEAELARVRRALERDAILRRPFLSANDRSRWCTVRALVEPDMRVPGAPYAIDRVIQERLWDTIDMVKHDGHLYSSKPPLFSTLVAGVYWILYNVFGLTLASHPYQVNWIVLIIFQWLPLLLYFWAIIRISARITENPWTQMFILAAACFGTCVTTFVVTLNNHVPGAVCAAVALELTARIVLDGQRRWWLFALLGLVASLGVTFELPALAFWLAILLVMVRYVPRPVILWYIAASILVATAFFYTNWLAHGTFTPPYAHRSGGEGENWYDYEYEVRGRKVESYWRNPVGIDKGEASPWVYTFHVLIGHHGIFSLTPIWLLALLGAGCAFSRRLASQHRLLLAIIAVVSVVCVVFYITRPQPDRSYGGMTCCFRWVLWLAPLWLYMMVPAVDRLSQSRIGRAAALILLAVSAMSAAYPTWNPWTHPWLFQWLESAGWIRY